MPLDRDFLLSLALPDVVVSFSDRDAMLYALSIGLASDPLDPAELRYVYEQGLKVFPTMAVLLSGGDEWLNDPRGGITPAGIVHGSERVEMQGALVPEQPVTVRQRISSVLDKGANGALVVLERTLFDPAGQQLGRIETVCFCRMDGQFDGPRGPAPEFSPVPARAPDRSVDGPVEPWRAALYRLNGDRNPLHIDPAFAQGVGFERPILHGLCSYGMSAVAIWRANPGSELRMIEARMASPVLPGCTLTVDMWDEPDAIAFQTRVGDRVVLASGKAVLAG